MFQRYWRVAVIGLGLGFVLGAGLFGLLAATGNPDWRANLTIAEVARSVSFYGTCGVGVAAASVLGSWVSIWVVDRRLQKEPGTRIGAAAVGAIGATLVLGAFVSGTVALLQGTTSWTVLLVVITIVLALLSGIAAAVLVSVREGRFPPQLSGWDDA